MVLFGSLLETTETTFRPDSRTEGVLVHPLPNPASFDVDTQWLAEMQAGSLVVFDANTIHGSEPNRSDRSRRTIVLTDQPADNPLFKATATATRVFSISECASPLVFDSVDWA